MKEPWCLAASTADEPARALIKLYAKRWEIEGGFHDAKDLRFGMGPESMHVSTPNRRDRLWLINAFAVVLLTLLGAAGEQLGYDRHLAGTCDLRLRNPDRLCDRQRIIFESLPHASSQDRTRLLGTMIRLAFQELYQQSPAEAGAAFIQGWYFWGDPQSVAADHRGDRQKQSSRPACAR